MKYAGDVRRRLVSIKTQRRQEGGIEAGRETTGRRPVRRVSFAAAPGIQGRLLRPVTDTVMVYLNNCKATRGVRKDPGETRRAKPGGLGRHPGATGSGREGRSRRPAARRVNWPIAPGADAVGLRSGIRRGARGMKFRCWPYVNVEIDDRLRRRCAAQANAPRQRQGVFVFCSAPPRCRTGQVTRCAAMRQGPSTGSIRVVGDGQRPGSGTRKPTPRGFTWVSRATRQASASARCMRGPDAETRAAITTGQGRTGMVNARRRTSADGHWRCSHCGNDSLRTAGSRVVVVRSRGRQILTTPLPHSDADAVGARHR